MPEISDELFGQLVASGAIAAPEGGAAMAPIDSGPPMDPMELMGQLDPSLLSTDSPPPAPEPVLIPAPEAAPIPEPQPVGPNPIDQVYRQRVQQLADRERQTEEAQFHNAVDAEAQVRFNRYVNEQQVSPEVAGQFVQQWKNDKERLFQAVQQQDLVKQEQDVRLQSAMSDRRAVRHGCERTAAVRPSSGHGAGRADVLDLQPEKFRLGAKAFAG